jgi:hypothetical protein
VDLAKHVQYLTGLVIKQDKTISSLKSTVLDLQRRSMLNNALDHNVNEQTNEDTVRVILQVMNDTRIPKNLQNFERAHRIGIPKQGITRPIVLRYTRQDDVQKLLAFTRPPKGEKLPRDKLRFSPQTPEEYRQQRAKLYEMANSIREKNKKADIVIKKDHIIVDKVTVTDRVKPPTAEQILLRSTGEEYGMQGIQFFTSSIVEEKSSRFQLFAANIENINQAQVAYKAVQRMRIAATSTTSYHHTG